MNDSNFWNDKENANKVIIEVNNLKEIIIPTNELTKNIDDNLETLELLEENDELFTLIEEETKNIIDKLENLKIQTYLSGEYDSNNCILEIHSGAGGTESCDWANMLYRMYTRYLTKNNYKIEELDKQPGEEVGIKSVMIKITGTNAYGYLKHEKGVHRLVRISPFDSNKRRHTSFASVEVTPEIDKSIEVDIQDKDLKIDIYRSSGPGGQGVNTTDSAVRITHLPTGIVVTCQNERSQIQNKEQALKVLKSKLLLKKLEEQSQELNAIKGSQMNIEFGSQIRSYVMHPYSMVKDHRTNEETSNVTKVLDGDIDLFIESNLKRGL